MSGFAEGLALGKAADIPLDSLLQVIIEIVLRVVGSVGNIVPYRIQVLDLGAMSNPMFRGKGPAMISGNFATNFPLKHQQKDMKYVVEYPFVYLFSHDGLFNCIMAQVGVRSRIPAWS